MAERNDVNSAKIALIGLFGVVVTAIATLAAIVLYFNVQARIERDRVVEAAERIRDDVSEIAEVGQPWLNPETQRAAQETALTNYGLRTIKEEDGAERTSLSMPIEQAMEAVLEDRTAERPKGRAGDNAASPPEEEAAT